MNTLTALVLLVLTFTTNALRAEAKDLLVSDALLSFNVPLELGVTSLLIYFDGEPALAYKIK